MHGGPWFPPAAPAAAPTAEPHVGPASTTYAAPSGNRPPVQPGTPRRSDGSKSRAGAVIALAAILAAGLGFGAGRLSSKSTPSAVLARAAQASSGGTLQPAATTAAPLSGNEAEPAAAVAKVLSPAVVQLQSTADLGSGFIYDKSGLILTAAHVVSGNSTMQVRLADGTQTTGKVLGADNSTDVAVVKITVNKDLPVAVLATDSKVAVGQTAIAIGSPYGLDQTVTEGIVSAVGRAIQTPGGEVAMIQTDAPINPGNSGGALADRMGRIIGINDSIISGSGSSSSGSESGNVGVGFAVPIDLAKSVADRIVAGEPLASGYLGISGNDATGSQAGALIVSVSPNSPAAKSGLREGDVVTQFDGTKVEGMEDLAAAVRTHQPNQTVTIVVLRGGKQLSIQVTLDKLKN